MLPSAAETASASQRCKISELNLHGLLPCFVRFGTHQSPGEWQHSLPACSLALPRRDSHPLDFIKWFPYFITGSPTSTLIPARLTRNSVGSENAEVCDRSCNHGRNHNEIPFHCSFCFCRLQFPDPGARCRRRLSPLGANW